MNINKTNKRYLRIGAAALAAGLTLGTAAAFALLKPEPTSYTVSSEEGGYYSETTYYLTEETYNGHAAKAAKNTGRQMSAASTSSAENTEDEEFVVGATKTVWVKETTDEEGNVTESRLLNKDEVEELRSAADNLNLGTDEDPEPTTPDAVIPYRPIGGGGGGNPETLIGTANGNLYLLDISLKVVYNSSTEEYSATGQASWAEQLVWFENEYMAAEESSFDYLAISWGGNGELKAKSKSISGKYYDGDAAVKFSTAKSDAYAGYVWQFNEKEGFLGDELENATANVTLVNVGAKQNKETSVKMTYIHTYDKFNHTPTFSFGVNGDLNGMVTIEKGVSVGLETVEDQWQIAIDVPNIEY